MRAVVRIGVALCWMGSSLEGITQCTDHTIVVTSGTWPDEISWQLVSPSAVVVASGFAPAAQTVCLPEGCYTMQLFDSFGDGWNGAGFTVSVLATGAVISSGTLNTGYSGIANVSVAGGCDPPGCSGYTLQVTAGTFPTEISWNLVGPSSIVASGGAPTTVSVCLAEGCHSMQLFDSFGDGWNGATWSLTNSGGTVVASGSLATGSSGAATIPLGVPPEDCGSTGGPVTASDCPQAVDICTNFNFQIEPNGSGLTNEIPLLGSIGNPDLLLGDGLNSPWGTDNWGCLRAGELNSTWMIVNIEVGGSLEFTFGGLGTQAGFYDWIMYPYTVTSCGQITSNTVPPVRCNWNGAAFGGTGLAATTPIGGDDSNFEPPLLVNAADRFMICFSNWSSVTTSVPLVFGGTAQVSCTPIILPVDLLGLEATASPDGIVLAWATASESGSERFEVHRSKDLDTWTPLAAVPAAGLSFQPLDYRWVDQRPLPGDNYYRLAMYDLDGSIEFSSSVHAIGNAPGPGIRPNPNTGEFTFSHAPFTGPLVIMDALGRSVPHSAVQLVDGLRIDLGKREPGVYTVLFTANGIHDSQQVLVLPAESLR